MSCLKTVLVFAVVFFEAVLGSPACCDNYNGNCALIVNQSICTIDRSTSCNWKDNACSNKVCSDYTTEGSCNGGHGSQDFRIICKWASGSCVTTTGVCSEWSFNGTYCNSTYDRVTEATCIFDGANCKAAVCADFSSSSSDCNSENSIGGNGNCKMDSSSSTCVSANACSDYSTTSLISYCRNHNFNGVDCMRDAAGTSCILESCSGRAQATCDDASDCYWTGSVCADFTSCSQTTNQTKCDYGSAGGKKCVYSSTCKDATCSDFDTSSTSCRRYGSYLSCKYDVTNSKCKPYACSEDANVDALCESECYALSSCPSTDDGSSAVFVPALFVAVLLSLFW